MDTTQQGKSTLRHYVDKKPDERFLQDLVSHTDQSKVVATHKKCTIVDTDDVGNSLKEDLHEAIIQPPQTIGSLPENILDGFFYFIINMHFVFKKMRALCRIAVAPKFMFCGIWVDHEYAKQLDYTTSGRTRQYWTPLSVPLDAINKRNRFDYADHQLYHDLESLFYVCIWQATGYTADNPTDFVSYFGWRKFSWSRMEYHKQHMLARDIANDSTLSHIDDDYHRSKCSLLQKCFSWVSAANDEARKEYDNKEFIYGCKVAKRGEYPMPLSVRYDVTFIEIMELLTKTDMYCKRSCCKRTRYYILAKLQRRMRHK